MTDQYPALTRLAILQARSLESPRPTEEEWRKIEAIVNRVVGLRDEMMFERYYVVARKDVDG